MIGRLERLGLVVGVLAIAAGCVQLPAGLKKPAGQEATITGRPLGAVSIAALSGTLLGPKPGLIANNSAGVIANNSGGLIANNGGGLISNHGAGYRVRHVSDLTAPAADATLTVVDLAGKVLSTKPARSDKDGRFKLTGLKPASGLVIVKATYTHEGQTVTLSAMVAARASVEGLTVDPATTLVAKNLAEGLRKGALRKEAVSIAALESAGREIAAAMSPRAVVAAAILSEAEAAETYAHMLDESAQLAGAIAEAEVSPSPGATPTAKATATPTAAPTATPSQAVSPTPTPAPTAAPTARPNGGRVSTYAGSGEAGKADGLLREAAFRLPESLTFAPQGVIYVADSGNNLIRRIGADGRVSTLAGSGDAGAKNATSPLLATFRNPSGIAVDAAGNLFVADRDNHVIRKIAKDGAVSTFAGSGSDELRDGVGAAAAFNQPTRLVFDKAGNLFVCDSHNHVIRKITPDGTVSTFAGSGAPGKADGLGAAARFRHPTGFCIDGEGNFYAAEEESGHVRKITPEGRVTTLNGDFGFPGGVAVDAAGTVYVAEMGDSHVHRITRAGQVDSLAGSEWGFREGTGGDARFDTPTGLALDAQGRLYVADTENHRIRLVE